MTFEEVFESSSMAENNPFWESINRRINVKTGCFGEFDGLLRLICLLFWNIAIFLAYLQYCS